MISHTCPQSQTRNGDETPPPQYYETRDKRQYGIVEDELKMRFHTKCSKYYTTLQCTVSILLHLTTVNVFTDC